MRGLDHNGSNFFLIRIWYLPTSTHRQLQKRERTGKSKVVFHLFEKLRYSNERSTNFESLNQEYKYLEQENGKMVAL